MVRRSLIGVLVALGSLPVARSDAFLAAGPAAGRIEAPSRSERAVFLTRSAAESAQVAAPRLERSGSLQWESLPYVGSPSLRAIPGSRAVAACPAAADHSRRRLVAAGPTSPRAPPVPPA